MDWRTERRRGAPLAPAGDLVDRHRRQLRVRLLLVLLPRRHDPVRGQADRRHLDRRTAAGRDAEARPLVAPRPLRAAPPALLQRAAGHDGGRTENTVCEVDSVPCRPAPTIRRTTPARPRRRCSRPSARRRRRSTRCTARFWQIENPDKAQPPRRPRRLQADARRERGADVRARLALRGARRVHEQPPVGHAPTTRSSATRPATTRTSTRAATACRAGRRRTARSRTPTSCSGTCSALTTSRGRRTGP